MNTHHSPRIVVAHGESLSVFHIVDPQAPEAEQPCVLETCFSLADAQRASEFIRLSAPGRKGDVADAH